MQRILIIEDQSEIRELIRLTLEVGEWEIFEAPDGQAGVEMAQRVRPDVVLLDVMMPGALDGVTVCERLRSDAATRRARIVMLSAMTRAEDRERGLRAGADAYLTKPFSPRNLLEVIERS